MENKTSKYFKYAIGEVVLVVIGILIALQINNWNEKRLDRLEEKAILETIKSDFKNAIGEFEDLNQNRRDLQNANKTIFSLIKAKELNYKKGQLDSILSILIIGPTYNSQTKTLEVLFNSGKINLITNNHIKDRLISWPTRVEDMKEGELQDIAVLRDQIIPLLCTYTSFFDLNRKFNFKDYNMFDKNLKSGYAGNYKDLFKDRDFENALSLRELYTKVALIETDELIKEADAIITMTNNYLESEK